MKHLIDKLAPTLAEAIATADGIAVVHDADDDAASVQFLSARFATPGPDGEMVEGGIGLVIDFPVNGLSPTQIERAEAWFRRNGVNAPKELQCMFHETGKPGWVVTWNATAGTDPQQAAALGLDLMCAVYGEPQDIEADTWRDDGTGTVW
jgi:hypothetical protein